MLKRFLIKLRVNSILCSISLDGAMTSARDTTFIDISLLVTCNAKTEEISKEIGLYEIMTTTKINGIKLSACAQEGSCLLSVPSNRWTGRVKCSAFPPD